MARLWLGWLRIPPYAAAIGIGKLWRSFGVAVARLSCGEAVARLAADSPFYAAAIGIGEAVARLWRGCGEAVACLWRG